MVTRLLIILSLAFAIAGRAQDAELTNYKSGIDVTWGGTKGTDYYEEYFFHDKLSSDAKVVYIKSSTAITMSHNARNLVNGDVVGANGLDGVATSGDEGQIRYKIDRDRQVLWFWTQHTTSPRVLAPAYAAPFTLASQTYDGSTAVVGTTGGNGGAITSKTAYYYRGIVDSFGDEWHVLTYADDDIFMLPLDIKYRASDAKSVLLVVNPKTPCFTARVTGTGQFFTTTPKAAFTPKIVDQTTYIAPGSSGTVTIELRDINGNNVFYRINGGSYTNAGASTVTLSDSAFSTGSNTLEYYYAGNAAYTKTRTVVKNPTHPSLAEAHGNYLWGDTTGYNTVLSRITRAPYLSTYNYYKTSGAFSASGQTAWDSWYHTGQRVATEFDPLTNAFVAKVEGFTYTRSGATKSYGQYTKEMLLENERTQNPTCFEFSHSGDASGNRELHAFGYYEAKQPLCTAFAYDIMVANFRDDQVTGGITAIEDYFVRDTLASFAYEAMQWSMDGTAFAPGMWGGARIMCSAMIAMIMPEYSTAYYGTSGFGTVQTTYPLCPFQDDELTWKEALFDETAPKTAWPNHTWGTGISNNGSEELFYTAGVTEKGRTFEEGDWTSKAAYFSSGQMGQWFGYWANMAKMWGSGFTNSRLEIVIERATAGTIWSGDSAGPYQFRSSMLLHLNSRWPNAAENAAAWVKTLPSNDGNSVQTWLSNAKVLGFAWYDDTYYGGVVADTTPPSLETVVVSASGDAGVLTFSENVVIGAGGSGGLTMSMTGGAVTATLGTPVANTIPVTFSRTIEQGQTGTCAYTQPTNGIEDLVGNDMNTISGVTVDNQSAATAPDTTAPSPTPTASVVSAGPNELEITSSLCTDAGSTVRYRFSIDDGATWSFTQTARNFRFTGLAGNAIYRCRVQALDSATVPNYTAASGAVELLVEDTPNTSTNIARARRSPVHFGTE